MAKMQLKNHPFDCLVRPFILIERCASRTEYAPKFYTFASTTAATNANANATYGTNATERTVNKTPKAPMRRCKLAELVNFGFFIEVPSIN